MPPSPPTLPVQVMAQRQIPDSARAPQSELDPAQYNMNQPDHLPLQSFPALDLQTQFQYSASLHPLDTSSSEVHPILVSPHPATPLSAGLRIQTDHLPESSRHIPAAVPNKSMATETHQQTVFNAGLPVRHSSIRSDHSARTHRTGSLSTSSAMSSPGVGPLVDMSPLPSPISAWGSPSLWRKPIDEMDEPRPEPRPEPHPPGLTPGFSPELLGAERDFPKKRKLPFVGPPLNDQQVQIYNTSAATHTTHAKSRSLSDYIPEGIPVPRSRNIVISSSGAPVISQAFSPPEDHMHREEHLAVQRGLTIPRPPTPPDSNRGRGSEELDRLSTSPSPSRGPPPTYYKATAFPSSKPKRWRAIRRLGEGQFSTVMLATSDMSTYGTQYNPSDVEASVNPKSLVAVKICEQGPAGGADEKKIEVSIKRELDILKSINHPSLVHLKAVSVLERQTLLVLNYCPGGDLFELASSRLEVLVPSLTRRIFAELVSATRYLHSLYIVHRDIKLENILVNLKPDATSIVRDWQTYPLPVVTLTDLGLGRYIPKPPESALLDRRCGSEDYAAPEVLMGQDYDGRSTDAWALGVTLYILMEGRMPFDPVPGSRRKSPTSHRIARCEWQWVKWADDDGEWDTTKCRALNGAREVVEGLLARTRNRWSLDKVQETEWVHGGIQVEGGLRRTDDDDTTDGSV